MHASTIHATRPRDDRRTRSPNEPRAVTLVWIDAQEAAIARWSGGRASLERMGSDVPAHHRSTGHLRCDPGVRHGGGRTPQAAAERHRREHLARFIDRVVERLPADEDLVILGPGLVRERLETEVRTADERQLRRREVECRAAPRMTGPQLIARLRHLAGADPRRRIVGAPR